MLRYLYILKFLSGLLLIVFILGITQKRVLHNIFANHIDLKTENNSDHPYQLTQSGNNCDTDNFVAGSVFVNDQHCFAFLLPSSFSLLILKNISFSSVIGIYSPLRGPPVTISLL